MFGSTNVASRLDVPHSHHPGIGHCLPQARSPFTPLGTGLIGRGCPGVRCSFPFLVEIPGRLSLMTIQLDVALRQLRSNPPTNTSDSGEGFNILTARVVNVNNTRTLVQEIYDGVVASKHAKRGLVDGIAQLSRMVIIKTANNGTSVAPVCYMRGHRSRCTINTGPRQPVRPTLMSRSNSLCYRMTVLYLFHGKYKDLLWHLAMLSV